MQVKRLKERDDKFGKYLTQMDKKYLMNCAEAITDVSQTKNILKAVTAARAKDFFTQLRKAWGDWDKIRRRILAIMGKYIESEDEKRMNYLKRKLLQWKDKAKLLTKEAAMNRVAKWTENKYRYVRAKENWREISAIQTKNAVFSFKSTRNQVNSQCTWWKSRMHQ